MGKPSRDKGARGERDLVAKLRAAGLNAVRVPLSGACKGFKGDVVVCGVTIECKVRARGFDFLYANMPPEGVLAVKRVTKGGAADEWLIVERLSDWVKWL